MQRSSDEQIRIDNERIEKQKQENQGYVDYTKDLNDKRLQGEQEFNSAVKEYDRDLNNSKLQGLDLIYAQENQSLEDELAKFKQMYDEKKITVEQWNEFNNMAVEKTARIKREALEKEQESNFKAGKQGLKQMETDLKGAERLGKGAVGVAKTLAIVNTTIASIEASIQAYKAMAGIPIIGPALGIAASASALLAGGLAVDKITATGSFRKGGYTGDGNRDAEAGIVHHEEYVATAETVDRVGIPALEALQDGRATIISLYKTYKSF